MLRHLSAMSDPTRWRLLRLLERQELTVSELCTVLQQPQSTVSRHLKTLADDGWILSRPEGTSRFYSMPARGLDSDALRLWRLIEEQAGGTGVAGLDDARLEAVLAARRSRSREFFASSAGQWDRLREELFRERFHFHALLRLLDESWVVGDLGCGTGVVAEVLAPCVRRVIAVDGCAEMLDAARARLGDRSNVEFRQGELERLPMKTGELDAALVFLVLHYVTDPARALREAARALRPGGKLLVVDTLPHERAEYRQQMGHVWLGFSEPQVERYLESSGFEGVRIRALPPDPGARGPGLFAATARVMSDE